MVFVFVLVGCSRLIEGLNGDVFLIYEKLSTHKLLEENRFQKWLRDVYLEIESLFFNI